MEGSGLNEERHLKDKCITMSMSVRKMTTLRNGEHNGIVMFIEVF